MSSRQRAFAPWRVFLAFAFTGLALLVGSDAASAHTELLGSDPADGANVTTSPPQITLTFTQRVQPGFSSTAVVGPDGTQFQAGAPVENGSTVSVPVRPLSTPGEYTTGYRVLSADGHPVEGSIRFVFSGSATQAAPVQSTATDPTATTSAPAAAGKQDGGTPLWPWLLGLSLLLVVGAIIAFRLR